MLASVGLLDLMWPAMTATLISGPKPTAAALLTPRPPGPWRLLGKTANTSHKLVQEVFTDFI